MEETAWILGFNAHDIPVLVSAGLLKPLGRPPQSGSKYFAGTELAALRDDPRWLAKASDAKLVAQDVDWENSTLSFRRKKTGVPVVIHLGQESLNLLKDLPSEGPLFPYLCSVRTGDRATEFKQRCKGLGIEGVTLHSYRYAWAERAKAAGYPERFAMQALGHNSAAVHRAYAKGAQMTIPALEEYECRRPSHAK